MEKIYVVTFHLFKPGELFYTIVRAYKTRNEAEKFCKDASDAYDETLHGYIVYDDNVGTRIRSYYQIQEIPFGEIEP